MQPQNPIHPTSRPTAGPGPSPVLDGCLVALLALAIVAVPIGAHLVGQPVGLALCAVLAALAANYVPGAVPTILLCGFLFQNLFVSLASPAFASPDEFNAARGYNFVATLTVWAVLSAAYWTGPRERRSTFDRLMLGTSAILALVAVYFALGAATDVKNAAIYLRNISIPFLVFQASLLAASRSAPPVGRALPVLAILVLAYGYAELLARADLFALVHGDTYLGYSMRQQIESDSWLRELRETGRVIRGIEDMLKVDLFNTPLLSDLKIRLYRLQGPNFHAISFAYALATLGLVRLAAGRVLPILLAVPLLVVIGSKGAILLVLFGGGATLLFAARRRALVWPGLLLVLAIVSATAVAIGIRQGDYHVVGLFGGISGFLKNPFGRGLGIGGNLSMDMTRIDWSKSQALGETDFAVESAVGVVLYQMGVAGLAVWLGPVAVAWTAWRLALVRNSRALAAASFAIAIVAANGLLQEEALFAPLAMGSCMVFAGLTLGGALRAKRAEPVPRWWRGGALAR